LIRILRASVVVSVLPVLITACGASPDGQAGPVGTTAQAVTVAGDCATTASPLTVVKTTRVYTPPDPSEGLKGGWSTEETCVPATAAPAVPAGGYPQDGTVTSCGAGFPVQPPAQLAGCTAGYAFSSVTYTISAFLCPGSLITSLNLPFSASPAYCSASTFSSATLADGCFGAPLDSTWGYVEVVTLSSPYGGMANGLPICGSPGPGCNGGCPRL
jgi:hypothetical protein